MTTEVITASPDETILSVREKLDSNTIHHIPVVESDKVIGIISMNDIHKLEHHFTLFNNPEAEQRNAQLFSTMLAKEIMTHPVITVRKDQPIALAASLFLENLFHALPIVDLDGKLCGMVTTFDMIRYCFSTPLNLQ